MKTLLFLQLAFCTIRKVLSNEKVSYVKNLLEKTVVLVETEVVYRNGPRDTWTTLDPSEDVEIKLNILASENKDWKDIMSNKKVVSEYTREGTKNSFFFTAGSDLYYLFELGINAPEDMGEYGLKTKIYEGRQKDPRIMSQTDTQIKDLEKHIAMAIEYSKQISDVQKMDIEDEDLYKRISASISAVIIASVLLKVVVILSTFYYFNRNIKDFYVSKKILSK